MDRELHFEDFEERDGRDNRIWMAICRCLIWIGLIGISLFFASRALIAQGEEMTSEVDIEEMDQSYLTVLSECDEKERAGLLQEYYQTWQQSLGDYLSQYEAACLHETDKEMVQEYRNALEDAAASQQELMTALGASSEAVLWYGIETCRTAYFGDLQGTVHKEDEILYRLDTKEDRDTSLTWCNELNTITMEAYEKLAQEDKALLTKWQICREEWKKAGDDFFGKEKKIEDRLAVYNQINQLYYQQLVCIFS